MAGLNKQQRDEVKDIAELAVRQYFDHYLTEVFPQQVKAFDQKLRAHDVNVFAHGGIVRRFAKFKYLLIGFAAAGGFIGGAGMERLVGVLLGH